MYIAQSKHSMIFCSESTQAGNPMTTRSKSALSDANDLTLRRRAVAARLHHLRTHARPRLTQHAAAAYIGLSASTGYRSIGQWESGEVIPSSTWQAPLRRYLWCALGLHTQPDVFAALWEDIAIAWEWPPLTALDWQELRRLICAGGAAAPDVTPAAAPAVQETILIANSSTAEVAASTLLQAPPRWATSHRVAVAGVLAGVLAALILAAAAFMPDFIVANPLFGNAPAPAPLAANLGFEAAQGLAPWAVVGDAACAQRLVDETQAHSGAHFLRIDTAGAGCTSLRYDLADPPALGATARFAVWARAAAPATESVELVLWSGQRTADEPAVGASERARFTVDDAAWRCLEVALPLTAPDVNLVRAELYFDDAAPVRIDLDTASLHFDGASACQGQTPRLINPGFETGVRHLGWSFLQDGRCDWEVVADATASHAGRRYLRVDRNTPECASLFQDLPTAPAPGVTYRARIWVRAAGSEPVQATWALWALGAETAAARQTMVATDEWRCVETALTTPLEAFDRLRAELYFDTPDAIYALDNAQLATGEAPLCPPQELLLNPDFEAEQPAPWQEIQRCLVTPEEGAAHSGVGFGRAEKTAECASLFQDVFDAIAPGDVATFSIWLRAAGTTPARGRLALRAIGAENELAEQPFILADANWSCLELALETQLAGHVHWRPEIYFSSEGALYDLDDAKLVRGPAGACPQTNYAVQRLAWLPGTVAYPGSSISGVVEIENLAEEATTWPATLRYWLAATRNGPPLLDEASGALTVPPLAADASSGPLYFDLALPPALETGKTYYLMLDTGATAATLPASQRRRALSLTLEPCAPDVLFCDIPTGFWAQTEAEAWYATGITSGCRSETQPYRDLPFCPQQTLSADTAAIFLLRHLIDPAFRPTQPYRGLYADVPESHRRSLWIEALHDEIGFVARSNCPQVDGEARFCPQAPLLREDLLRFLFAAVKLEPAEGATPHFVDLAGDPELAALATAAWEAGILPDDDPACPDLGVGPRFCPQEPARRIDGAVWMVRAFAP
jgi:hypothetical protein